MMKALTRLTCLFFFYQSFFDASVAFSLTKKKEKETPTTEEEEQRRLKSWSSSVRRIRGVPMDPSATGNPIPKPFPDIFQIDFITNITWVEKTTTTLLHDDDYIPGRLFYDWTTERQRIDHGSGSYECVHFYNHDGPCSLIFIPDWGMYRILVDKEKKNDDDTNVSWRVGDPILPSSLSFQCCLDIPNLGTPPPHWAELGNPTYNGIVHDEISQTSTHEWVYDNVTVAEFRLLATKWFRTGTTTETTRTRTISEVPEAEYQRVMTKSSSNPAEYYHTTRQVAVVLDHRTTTTGSDNDYEGRPVSFTFPSAGGLQDYHYLIQTMQELDHMDDNTFDLPNGCLQQFCKCSS